MPTLWLPSILNSTLTELLMGRWWKRTRGSWSTVVIRHPPCKALKPGVERSWGLSRINSSTFCSVQLDKFPGKYPSLVLVRETSPGAEQQNMKAVGPHPWSFHRPWDTDIPCLTLEMLQEFEMAKQEEGSETSAHDAGMKGRRKKRRKVKILLLSQTRTIDSKLLHSTFEIPLLVHRQCAKLRKAPIRRLQIHTVWFVDSKIKTSGHLVLFHC